MALFSSLKVEALLRAGKRWTSSSYTGTTATELAVLSASVVGLRLAALEFAGAGFSEYLLARRAIGLSGFTLLMGMGIGVPRYVALHDDEAGKAGAYLLTAFGLVSALASAALVISVAMREQLSLLIFGNAHSGDLVTGLGIWSCALTLHSLAHGFFRGKMRMKWANLLQLASFALIPLLAICASQGSVARSLLFAGFGVLTVSILGLIAALAPELGAFRWRDVRSCGRELITYGAPRVIGEFSWFGLFAVPTFVAARTGGIETAGALSFGLNMVQILAAGFSGVGMQLLPSICRMSANGDTEAIDQLVGKALKYGMAMAVVAVALAQLFLPVAVDVFTAGRFSDQMTTLRWLVAGALPCMAYIVLRQPLDAVSVLPVNSVALAGTLVSVVTMLKFLSPPLNGGMVIAFGLTLLGCAARYGWQYHLRNRFALAATT